MNVSRFRNPRTGRERWFQSAVVLFLSYVCRICLYGCSLIRIFQFSHADGIDTINGWPGLDRYSLLYPLLEFRQETISSVEKVGKLFELFSSSVKA